MALDHIGRLLRTAGAGRKPALWNGDQHSVDLCGLPWAGQVVRASVRLDGQGSLVLAPLKTGGNAADCHGEDLTAPWPLVPGFVFADIEFRYMTRSGEIKQCSQASSPPCKAVTGVYVRVTPRGAVSSSGSFVALRNPGGP